MLKGKHIAVISTNCLQGLGLKSMLIEYFSPESVVIFSKTNDFNHQNTVSFDFVLLNADIFISSFDILQAIKNKLILLLNNTLTTDVQLTSYAVVNTTFTEPEIVEQFEKIFLSRVKNHTGESQEELSARETEVLKLVAVGFINKQIADQLFISLHTVITHRKNINRKLGIKTVSGLTVYALMNGLISSDQDKG